MCLTTLITNLSMVAVLAEALSKVIGIIIIITTSGRVGHFHAIIP